MLKNNMFKQWYPKYYDRRETQTYDCELFIDLLKGRKRKVLEICCGTGRILIPLAKEGHEMHGIDMDNYMLAKLMEKVSDVDNVHITKGNAITTHWGNDYDAVIMAGNIVMNIEDSDDPKKAQKAFIQKSYNALKAGGYFIMDNDCYRIPEERFVNRSEPIIRDFGTDDNGVSAQMTYVWSTYDSVTQICTNLNRLELTAEDGEKLVKETKHVNHIPTLNQMVGWVEEAGFTILNQWGDHYRNPVADKTNRLVIWAQKK